MGVSVVEATCLEVAAEAWRRPRRAGDTAVQEQDCERLASFGVFSNRQLAAITGLDWRTVQRISPKTERWGGRLEMATLPLMVQLQQDYAAGSRNKALLRAILDLGTSTRTVARLTGIHLRAVERMSA